jgi:hypothetical protein
MIYTNTFRDTPVAGAGDVDQAQDRFGRLIAIRLEQGSQGLPHDISERLRAARVRAVGQRKREVGVALVQPQIAAAGIGQQLGDQPDLWSRLASALPVLVLAAGLVFGLLARVFAVVVPALKRVAQHEVLWPPLRPVIGGVATLALMGLFGREYLGLSLPLADLAFTGAHVDWQVPILKLVFTAVALGSGFVGGEVTPLFVVGATAGSVIAGPLGLPPVAMAAIGLAAVFGAASNAGQMVIAAAPDSRPALGLETVARALCGREPPPRRKTSILSRVLKR